MGFVSQDGGYTAKMADACVVSSDKPLYHYPSCGIDLLVVCTVMKHPKCFWTWERQKLLNWQTIKELKSE
jgi:hypothetical protein